MRGDRFSEGWEEDKNIVMHEIPKEERNSQNTEGILTFLWRRHGRKEDKTFGEIVNCF